MAGRQAKVLAAINLRRMLKIANTSSTPERDQVMILLSVHAGLRACEISGLEWSMVLEANGRMSRLIQVPDPIAKNGSGRSIPMHPLLNKALRHLKAVSSSTGPIIRSAKGGALRPNSIVNWFAGMFRELGLEGCSSHSGRRTFITRAAREAHKAGASLRDVQLLAGHRSIETTQGYIDGDSDAQHRLVRRL